MFIMMIAVARQESRQKEPREKGLGVMTLFRGKCVLGGRG